MAQYAVDIANHFQILVNSLSGGAKRGGGSLVREGPQLHPFEGENVSYGLHTFGAITVCIKISMPFQIATQQH